MENKALKKQNESYYHCCCEVAQDQQPLRLTELLTTVSFCSCCLRRAPGKTGLCLPFAPREFTASESTPGSTCAGRTRARSEETWILPVHRRRGMENTFVHSRWRTPPERPAFNASNKLLLFLLCVMNGAHGCRPVIDLNGLGWSRDVLLVCPRRTSASKWD